MEIRLRIFLRMVGEYEPRSGLRSVLLNNTTTNKEQSLCQGSNLGSSGRESYTCSLVLIHNTFFTLSQTTNFKLYQTERVCRRQFQIWRKVAENFPNG